MSDPWLIGPLTTTAYGWRLERRDGVVLGLTSHDQDIIVDGLLHLSSPGMIPSSISETTGLGTDGLEVKGALSSEAMTNADLNAGRWDLASVLIYLFDWTNPALGKRILASGALGELSFSDQGFEADLRGLTYCLDRDVVPLTSPGCRARFCDSACGLSQRRFSHEIAVQSVIGEQVLFQNPLPVSDGAFTYGHLQWLQGPNTGLVSDILSGGATHVTLVHRPTYPVLASMRAILIEGCDKRLATCSSRFNNAINFRGEPYLPGNDLLTRYPGAS
jgi:uncharacterized phage protein (TIGR02218 family)